MKLKKKTMATLLIAIFMISIFAVAIPVSAEDAEYSYSESIIVSDGTVGNLEVTVEEDGDWMVWTFDFPVEQFTGDGNLNVGLIIALDGDGYGPAFQIHNTDSNEQTFIDGTLVPAGTWAMSPFDTTIGGGWIGWHGELNTLVSDLDWVEASGLRNTPWTGVVEGDGVMTIRIERAVLGNEFHWAASPTVGSGFFAPAADVTMQVPTGFGWGTPIVDMNVPNYVHVPLPPPISIDGVLSTGEWDGATEFAIGGYTGYVTNDDEYMYVGYDYAITTCDQQPGEIDLSVWEWAEIITYKAGMDPETEYISMVWKTPPPIDPLANPLVDPRGYATWLVTVQDTLEPIGKFTGPYELNEWVGTVQDWLTTLIDYEVDTATEMKIPLTALGLTSGDSIKILLGLNIVEGSIHLYPDGADSEDPSTYADYTLRGAFTGVPIDGEAGGYTLTTSVDGTGEIGVSGDAPIDGVYVHGSVVQLTATTIMNWHFDHWSDAVGGSANPESIVMDNDYNVIAHFVADIVSITVEPIEVEFGKVIMGTASDPQTIKITNTGNVDITVGVDVVEGDPFFYTEYLTLGDVAVSSYSGAIPDGTSITPELVLDLTHCREPGTYSATLVFWAEKTS